MSEMPQNAADNSAPIDLTSDFFAKSGPVPTAWHEARRFPRFYYRARVPTTIHPFGGRPAVSCTMLARDLSRGGMNLLYTEQLFPGQRMDVTLRDGAQRLLEIVWCRRLANRCYSLGCRFVKPADPSPAPPSGEPSA
jgi:hypothetical protein